MLGRNGKGLVPNNHHNSSCDNLAAQEGKRHGNLNHQHSQKSIPQGSVNHGGKEHNSHIGNVGTIILQGTLTKKGRGSLYHPWSPRFITVDDCGILRYYKQAPSSSNKSFSPSRQSQEDKSNLRGAIDIKGCKIRPLSPEEVKSHRPFSFILEQLPSQYATQSSTLTLAATSSTEMQGWISLLRTLVTTLAEQELDKSKIQYETLNGLISKGNASNSTIAEFRQLKEMRRQQQRQRDALLDVISDEANNDADYYFANNHDSSGPGSENDDKSRQHTLMMKEPEEINKVRDNHQFNTTKHIGNSNDDNTVATIDVMHNTTKCSDSDDEY